jgi:DNA polymerase
MICGIEESKLRGACLTKGVKYIGTRGDTSAPCVVIGEAPGADEDASGIPFCGASGREQDKMMAEAGFDMTQVWFTNLYKVRPPNNELARLSEIGIPSEMFEKQLLEELGASKPTIIICAGATSLGFLCPETRARRTSIPIGRWRGSLLVSPRLSWPHYVIPVQHPAFVLREWSERQISVFIYQRAWEELCYWHNYDALAPLPQRQLIVAPPFETIVEFLRDILAKPNDLANATAADIEMIRCRMVYSIAIATSPDVAISWALWDYPTDKCARILRLLDEVLRTRKLIGQNYYSFDAHWLRTIGIESNIAELHDTLVRHHVLWPEFEHTLHFQTMQYTREPYYKDEGRKWKPSDGKERLLRYGAKDAAVDYEIFLEQEKEFAER